MDSSGDERNPVEELAEEFIDRHRRGERPTLHEYTARYPHLADDIRDLFPALIKMEKVRPQTGDATGAYGDGAPGAETQLERLGDYRILREVGRGGMGIVYEAEQESLGRHVALKLLPRHALLDGKQVQRFQREARAAARLHHTNIVPVYGVGEASGLHYYVMQFIQGLGLDEVLHELKQLKQLRQGSQGEARPGEKQDLSAVQVAQALLTGDFHPAREVGLLPGDGQDQQAEGPRTPSSVHLPGQAEGSTLSETGRAYWQSVARIGIQVAEAVAHASSQGTLHRDIKPSNLLLDTHGTVWVTDFGLAKAEGSADLTHTGEIVGTLRYMPPERFQGHADVRGDIYSLGLTLYELLTLRSGYETTDRHQLMQQIMREDPPPPRRLNPQVPRDLETIILKAVAREPLHRYQTAGELADDLRRFLEDKPIHARRVSARERLWRWCRRNPLVAGLVAAVAMLLLAGTVVSTLFALLANQEKDRADAKAAEAKAQALQAIGDRKRADASAAEARRSLYGAHINLAESAWRDGHVDKVLSLLGRYQPLKGQPDELRGFEWFLLDRWCHADLRTLAQFEKAAFRPGMDRHLVVVPLNGKEIWLWDLAKEKKIRTFRGHAQRVHQVVFSPDGKQLASVASSWPGKPRNEINLWEVDTGRRLLYLRDPSEHKDWGQKLTFSPDGKRIALVESSHVRLWEVATGKEFLILRRRQPSFNGGAFSPDGQKLAVARYASITIHDSTNGRLIQTLFGHEEWVSGVAYSPDGCILASAGADGRVRLWDLAKGTTRNILLDYSAVHAVAFSPDGRLVAAAGENKTVKVWNITNGMEVTTLVGHTLPVWDVAFSPDGTRLLSCGGNGPVKIWDLVPAEELQTIRCLSTQGLAFSPDGKQLVAPAKTWDVVTGQEIHSLGHSGEGPIEKAFTATGEPLAWVCSNQTVTLLDPATGKNRFTLGKHAGSVTTVAASPDGRWLAVGSGRRSMGFGHGHEFGGLTLWSTADGKRQYFRPVHQNAIHNLVFSPDGNRLASGNTNGTATIWDRVTGKELRTLAGHGGGDTKVAFSRDGKRLASAGRDTAKVWNSDTGKLLLTLQSPTDALHDVVFSPDGKRLATASMDKTVKIWDAASGQELLTLRGHGAEVAVAFSPDGQRLASASRDGTIRLWDARPATREVREEREALGLLHTLFQRPLLKTEVMASILQNPALSETVRRKALTLAALYRDDPEYLNDASWKIVRQPGLPRVKYQQALRFAETACRLEPGDGNFLNTLGVAQYRLGQYRKVLATLTKANKINAVSDGGSMQADLAFLAMAQFHLGQKELARATLTRLRQAVVLEGPLGPAEPESADFLREAEQLIEGKRNK